MYMLYDFVISILSHHANPLWAFYVSLCLLRDRWQSQKACSMEPASWIWKQRHTKSNLKPRWITSPHGVRISLDSRSQSVNFSRNLRSLTEKSRKSSSLSVKGINLLVKTLPSIKRSSVWTAAHGSNVKGESTTSPRCKVTIGPPTFLKIKDSCCGCVNK